MQKLVTLLTAILILSGCSVFRGERKSTATIRYADELSLANVRELNLTENDFSIQRAEIKYFDEETEVNLVASLKHRAGNEYLVSLRTRAGIEIARLFVSEDTLLVNDRINKKLYCGSSGYLEEKYGITTDGIPLLFGDLVLTDNQEEKVICQEGKGIFGIKTGLKEIRYFLDCNEKKVSGISIGSEDPEKRIDIELSGFKTLGNMVYPEIIELKENYVNSNIRIEIKKIDFTTVDNISFIPGTNYEIIVIR